MKNWWYANKPKGRETENRITIPTSQKLKFVMQIVIVVMQLLRNSDVIYVILIQFRLQNRTVCRHGGFLIICRKNSTDGKMVVGVISRT